MVQCDEHMVQFIWHDAIATVEVILLATVEVFLLTPFYLVLKAGEKNALMFTPDAYPT